MFIIITITISIIIIIMIIIITIIIITITAFAGVPDVPSGELKRIAYRGALTGGVFNQSLGDLPKPNI